MSLANGGHLTHGSPVNASGKLYHFIPYGVDPATGRIDYDEVEQLVKENRPKLVVAGASAYPRTIDFKIFGEIAHRYGALLMVDMAHISGLARKKLQLRFRGSENQRLIDLRKTEQAGQVVLWTDEKEGEKTCKRSE